MGVPAKVRNLFVRLPVKFNDIAAKSLMIISGNMQQDPEAMSLSSTSYGGEGCREEALFFNTRLVTKVSPANDVEKNYNIYVDDARFTFSKTSVLAFNCTPAVEPDVEYSLKWDWTERLID